MKKNYAYIYISIVMILISSFPIWAKDFVVVIDAGHGGHDSGAVGRYAYEKNITLNVAKRLGTKIESNYDSVKVVYTRSSDKYITLQQRAKIANKANGDLFISIHVNSVDIKNKNRKKIAGASVFTLGLHKSDDNLAVAKRENSVIELEKDYSTTYSGFDPNSTESYIIFEMNQNKHMQQSIEFASSIQEELINTAGREDKGVRQAGFWVLWATSMPSVLVELDFICNPKQEEYLSSGKGQEQLSSSLFNAFQKYYASYSKQTARPSLNQITRIEKTLMSKDDTLNNREVIYRIQILTSSKKLRQNDKEFKGLNPIWNYTENSIYKYTYGAVSSMEEAKKILKDIKVKFPQAFIAKFKNDKRIK